MLPVEKFINITKAIQYLFNGKDKLIQNQRKYDNHKWSLLAYSYALFILFWGNVYVYKYVLDLL